MEMQQSPKISFYVQRTFGEKMNASFDFIKENWKVMFKYITYLILPVCLIQALSMNAFIGYYMNTMMEGLDFTNFDPRFFASYGFTLLCAVIGFLLISSLIYALVKLYNDREERLVGITFNDIKPLLFKNMGRLFLVYLLLGILYFLSAIVVGVLAAVSPLTFLVTIPAMVAMIVASLVWPPIYIFENIGFAASFAKAFRMGFATWGGLFAVLFIMGIIASIVQGVISTPWYVATVVKSLFTYSNEGTASDSSLLYNVLVYILGVAQAYGAYISMIFAILGVSYQYAHASEKLDSVTVESEIDNFENL